MVLLKDHSTTRASSPTECHKCAIELVFVLTTLMEVVFFVVRLMTRSLTNQVTAMGAGR